jgi:hypothetical protein
MLFLKLSLRSSTEVTDEEVLHFRKNPEQIEQLSQKNLLTHQADPDKPRGAENFRAEEYSIHTMRRKSEKSPCGLSFPGIEWYKG